MCIYENSWNMLSPGYLAPCTPMSLPQMTELAAGGPSQDSVSYGILGAILSLLWSGVAQGSGLESQVTVPSGGNFDDGRGHQVRVSSDFVDYNGARFSNDRVVDEQGNVVSFNGSRQVRILDEAGHQLKLDRSHESLHFEKAVMAPAHEDLSFDPGAAVTLFMRGGRVVGSLPAAA